MSKISELSDGGALQSTDYLIAVRSGGNVKVRPNGAVSGTTGQFSTSLNVDGTVTADGLTLDGSNGKIYLPQTPSTFNWLGDAIEQTGILIDPTNDDSSETVGFYTNNAKRLDIDAGGDISFYEDTGTTPKFFWDASAEALGIGTSSPAAKLEATGNTGSGSDSEIVRITSTDSVSRMVLANSVGQGGIDSTGDNIRFINTSSNTERMRLDASGNLLVGTTTTGPGAQSGVAIAGGATSSDVYIRHANGTSSGAVYAAFIYNTSQIGSITQNGTIGVLYNVSSDYRLKDVDGPITNSGAYIDALKPVQGSWKADGSRFIGLIAHEVQEVSETPIATGEKDGEEMQGMDYSAPELIANLIAEIQSLRARVAQLEGV